MGATANNIRAGGAFVELTADDAKLHAGLQRAQTRIKFFGRALTAAFVVRGLKNMSDALTELVEKAAAGENVSWQNYAMELAKSLPVLGDMVSFWQNVIGLIDGSTVAAAKHRAELERIKEADQLRAKLLSQSLAAERSVEDAVMDLQAELAHEKALREANTDEEREKLELARDYARVQARLSKMTTEAMGISDDRRRNILLRQITSRREQAAKNHAEALAAAGRKAEQDREDRAGAIRMERADLEERLAQDLRALKIAGIEDEGERARAEIEARYELERKELWKNWGASEKFQDLLNANARNRQAALANLDAQQARQREASIKSLDEQIAEARDAADAGLTDQDRRLRAIDRQEAAALAGAERGGAVDLEIGERIARLAELQRQAVNMADIQSPASAGVFSGAMLQSLQGGAVSAAEETARNTATLVKLTAEQGRAIRDWFLKFR